jgi:hypothetical protein
MELKGEERFKFKLLPGGLMVRGPRRGPLPFNNPFHTCIPQAESLLLKYNKW